MNVLAASMRCARILLSPSTTPPWLASDLDSVAVTTTSGSPARPDSWTSPRPPAPRTPMPCASSTNRIAPYSRHT
ncbi:hypothetical protein EN35_22370 [Rhodococcus qingshengii]|nr:hypothetical protein EN35_22370 [Rhodococcus qingshengii]